MTAGWPGAAGLVYLAAALDRHWARKRAARLDRMLAEKAARAESLRLARTYAVIETRVVMYHFEAGRDNCRWCGGRLKPGSSLLVNPDNNGYTGACLGNPAGWHHGHERAEEGVPNSCECGAQYSPDESRHQRHCPWREHLHAQRAQAAAEERARMPMLMIDEAVSFTPGALGLRAGAPPCGCSAFGSPDWKDHAQDCLRRHYLAGLIAQRRRNELHQDGSTYNGSPIDVKPAPAPDPAAEILAVLREDYLLDESQLPQLDDVPPGKCTRCHYGLDLGTGLCWHCGHLEGITATAALHRGRKTRRAHELGPDGLATCRQWETKDLVMILLLVLTALLVITAMAVGG